MDVLRRAKVSNVSLMTNAVAMHAEVAPRHPAQRDEGLGRAVAWAVGLHLLLAVLLSCHRC